MSKYKAQDIYNIESFNKFFAKYKENLKEIDTLQKGIGGGKTGKDLQKNQEALKKLDKVTAQFNKTQKERIKTEKQITVEQKKKLQAAKKLSDSLNLEIQKEREVTRLKQKRVREEAKLAAQLAVTGKAEAMTIGQLQKKETTLIRLISKVKKGSEEENRYQKELHETREALKKKNAAGGLSGQIVDKQTNALKRGIAKIKEYVKGLGLMVAAYAAFRIIKESVKLFLIQEQAVRDNRAVFGAYSKTLQSYAADVQKVTRVGDEQTLALTTQARNFGLAVEDVQDATSGAIGLSEKFKKAGLSQETALKGIALAYQGNFSQLERYIPALRNAKTEAEKMTILQMEMAAGFDLAKESAKSSAGQIEQMKNNLGDLQEKIGKEATPSIVLFSQAISFLVINFDKFKRYLNAIKVPINIFIDLLKQARKDLVSLGLLAEESRSMKDFRVRVDELTASFKALSKEQKEKALKDFNKLNEEFKAGKITSLEYAAALNQIVISAQNTTVVIPKVTGEVEELNKALTGLGEAKGKSQEDKGSIAGIIGVQPEQLTQIETDLKGAFETAKNETTKFQDYINNVFNGKEGSFLSRVFGGGKEGAAIAQQVQQIWGQLMSVISNAINTQLQNINALIKRQDDQIAKTEDLLQAELDKIAKIEETKQAVDLTEKQRLEAKLKVETQAREKSFAEEKKIKQQQKRLAIVQANVSIASAVLQALGSSPPPANFILAAIVAALGAVQLTQIASAKYADGTEYLHLNGNPKGKDTIPIYADEGERIVSKRENAKIGNFPNRLLPAAVAAYKDAKSDTYILDTHDDKYLKEIARNTKNADRTYRNGMLYQERTNNMINTFV